MNHGKLYLLLAVVILSASALSQSLTQTIKGKIIDQETYSPLIAANVIVRGTNPVLGATTDYNGYFRISGVPLGRYDIQANYIGYEASITREVVVSSGREVVLNIELKESVIEIEAVTVLAPEKKELAINSMAAVSARSFTVEETRRYAGGMDDPARLAASFAGVTTGAPQDNAIVVRGNSPKGLLWQVEGVKIPNPNHFPDMNVAGGGFVSILSSQVVTNSDFYTGAFPAEYGNALAGVFDLRIREGNDEKREYTFQAGLMGIDFAAEGPLSLAKGGSFLFNYRYSTFGLIKDLIPTEQIPRYSDLAFKIALPTEKIGRFSFWGIGAWDQNEEFEQADSSKWETAWDRMAYDLDIGIQVLGMSHTILLGSKAYLKSSAVNSSFSTVSSTYRLDDDLVLQDALYLENKNGTSVLTSYLNVKFSARHTNRTGFTLSRLSFDLDQKASLDNQPPLTTLVQKNDSALLLQFYSQSRLNLSENLVFNFGFHSLYFELNRELSFEPRAGLAWKISDTRNLTLGYGSHSQLEELSVYFVEQGTPAGITRPNTGLGLSRANHLVLAYQQRLRPNLYLKVEPYLQNISNIPVIEDSSFSMLNFKQEWTFNSPLVNNGSGRNLGIDITLERFLQDNMYYLVTASIFDSKYVGGDDVERPTVYSTGYRVNGLWGKEFYVGRTHENVFGINLKLTAAAGARMSPPDFERTIEARELVTDEYRAFEDHSPNTALLDISLIYRKNKPKYTSTWAFQLMNVLGSSTQHVNDYNYRTGKVVTLKEKIIVPSLSYKIEF